VDVIHFLQRIVVSTKEGKMMHPLRSIMITAAVLAAAAPDRAAAQSTEAPAQSTEAPLQIEEAPAQSVEEVQDLVVSDPFSPLSGDNGFADETETESGIPGLLAEFTVPYAASWRFAAFMECVQNAFLPLLLPTTHRNTIPQS
jgi:hypothetical protein